MLSDEEYGIDSGRFHPSRIHRRTQVRLPPPDLDISDKEHENDYYNGYQRVMNIVNRYVLPLLKEAIVILFMIFIFTFLVFYIANHFWQIWSFFTVIMTASTKLALSLSGCRFWSDNIAPPPVPPLPHLEEYNHLNVFKNSMMTMPSVLVLQEQVTDISNIGPVLYTARTSLDMTPNLETIHKNLKKIIECLIQIQYQGIFLLQEGERGFKKLQNMPNYFFYGKDKKMLSLQLWIKGQLKSLKMKFEQCLLYLDEIDHARDTELCKLSVEIDSESTLYPKGYSLLGGLSSIGRLVYNPDTSAKIVGIHAISMLRGMKKVLGTYHIFFHELKNEIKNVEDAVIRDFDVDVPLSSKIEYFANVMKQRTNEIKLPTHTPKLRH